jgi:hypothetical protein
MAATAYRAIRQNTAHLCLPRGSIRTSDYRSGYVRFQNHDYRVARPHFA